MKLRAEQVAYLDGLLDGFDDLPDGAWQAACESVIATCGEFKGKDPFDVWMAWCMAKGDA